MEKIELNKIEYQKLEQIGEGGNGIVYKVEKEGEFFALKLVKSSDNIKAKRFEKECKFAYETQHERIVKCLDYGIFPTGSKNKKNITYYCLMPLYKSNLRDFINEGQSDETKLNIAIQICEALSFIHGSNIIHRDIKPENILVDENGDAALADFGIAHFDDFKLTKSGRPLANFTYRAPEQLEGNDKISCGTDIYSFGLIINEMFTGKVPQGNNYLKIADINIYYNELDNLVERMLLQNMKNRLSNAKIVRYNIEIILEVVKEKLSDIQDNLLFPNQPKEIKDGDLDYILSTASHDILLATYYLMFSPEKFDSSDSNYNMIINYKVSEFLLNLSIQESILDVCTRKFEYESNNYRRTKCNDHVLNLSKKKDNELYDEMLSLINEYYVKDEYDLSGKILKYFSACKDYHCAEIINSCRERIKECKENLMSAPILWIFCYLKRYLKKSLEGMVNDSYWIEFEIFIDWECTMKYYSSGNNFQLNDVYKEEKNKENIAILYRLKEKYSNVTFDFFSKDNSAKLYFPNQTSYDIFRQESLIIAKPHYIFEGDVLDMLRIKRKGKKCIELQLSFFDIENVIPKLLGLRKI